MNRAAAASVRRTPAQAAAQINAELRRKQDEVARKANEARQFAQAQQASFGTAPEEALPYRSRQLLRQEREKALRQLQEQNKFLIGRSGYLGAAALQGGERSRRPGRRSTRGILPSGPRYTRGCTKRTWWIS